MSGSTVRDHESRSVSASVLEEEKETREEAEIAAVGGDIEHALEKTEEESKKPDPFLVTWSGVNDPENPLNFSSTRKFSLMGAIAALAFLTYLSRKQIFLNSLALLARLWFRLQFPT